MAPQSRDGGGAAVIDRMLYDWHRVIVTLRSASLRDGHTAFIVFAACAL